MTSIVAYCYTRYMNADEIFNMNDCFWSACTSSEVDSIWMKYETKIISLPISQSPVYFPYKSHFKSRTTSVNSFSDKSNLKKNEYDKDQKLSPIPIASTTHSNSS